MLKWFHTVYWRRKQQFLLETDTYETWVLFAVEEGAFRFRIGESEGVAEPGAVVACPPGVPFRRRTVSPVSFHFLRLDVEDDARAPLREGLLRVASHARLSSNLAYLKRYADDASPEAEALKRHLLQDMLYFCFQAPGRDDEADPSSDDPLMRSAAASIRERAHEKPFAIRQVAEDVGLSPVQFSRRFQAAYRMTPIRYLTECRIQLAKELLAGTNFTLEEIAVRCGYENAFYLSRVFKRIVSSSPSAYRKAHQV